MYMYCSCVKLKVQIFSIRQLHQLEVVFFDFFYECLFQRMNQKENTFSLVFKTFYLDTILQTPKNGKNKTQNAACVVYLIRSWEKLFLFEGTESKSLLDTIKSTQRIILAPNIIIRAEVNGDMQLPKKNFNHFNKLLQEYKVLGYVFVHLSFFLMKGSSKSFKSQREKESLSKILRERV